MSVNSEKIAYQDMTPHRLISMKSDENSDLLNKNTAIAYNRVWRDFSEYLDDADVHHFDYFSKSHVLHFLKKYAMKPFAYNQARSAIIKILNDIECDYDIKIPKLDNIRKQIQSKKTKTDDRLFLTVDELKAVRETAYTLFTNTASRERNLLVFDLMVHTLMRVDEVALVRLEDINITSKTLGVRGKGSSSDTRGNRAVSATIPLSPELISQAVQYVRRWRHECADDPVKPYLDHPKTIHPNMPLFTSYRAKGLNVSSIKQTINRMIEQYFIEMGKTAPKNHGAHCIRRSIATLQYEKHKDIVLVQGLLRHASPTTTMKYINLGEDKLSKAYLDGVI